MEFLIFLKTSRKEQSKETLKAVLKTSATDVNGGRRKQHSPNETVHSLTTAQWHNDYLIKFRVIKLIKGALKPRVMSYSYCG